MTEEFSWKTDLHTFCIWDSTFAMLDEFTKNATVQRQSNFLEKGIVQEPQSSPLQRWKNLYSSLARLYEERFFVNSNCLVFLQEVQPKLQEDVSLLERTNMFQHDKIPARYARDLRVENISLLHLEVDGSLFIHVELHEGYHVIYYFEVQMANKLIV